MERNVVVELKKRKDRYSGDCKSEAFESRGIIKYKRINHYTYRAAAVNVSDLILFFV
jgi:hypothetical protein